MENIKIGQIVEVTKSFVNENEVELQGKKGIVRLLYDEDPTEKDSFDEVLIEWTPESLDTFEKEYFYSAFEQEVSWTSYILPTTVLTPTDETLDENELAWKKQELFARLFLGGLPRGEANMIVKVFETPVDPKAMAPIDCWKAYLEKTLRFPVKVKVCYPYEEGDGPLKENQKLKLTELNGVDKSLGILAEVTDGTASYVLPLQDLTGGDQFGKDGKYIDAYGLWLVCNS